MSQQRSKLNSGSTSVNPFSQYQHRQQQTLQLLKQNARLSLSPEFKVHKREQSQKISMIPTQLSNKPSISSKHHHQYHQNQTPLGKFKRDQAFDFEKQGMHKTFQSSTAQKQTFQKTQGNPFWGTTYKTFYEHGGNNSRFLVSSRDMVNNASSQQYSRYKPKPLESLIDYSKFKDFNEYINNLNYECTESPIYRNHHLRNNLDNQKKNFQIPEAFNNSVRPQKQRAASAAKYVDTTARVFSPMTKFKKNLEDNRIQSKWKMSAYRSYIKGF